MKYVILNQQGHNFGDEIAGCALIEKIKNLDNSADISVLYASDSALPIVNDSIHHFTECSLRNVGIVRVLKYLLLGNGCDNSGTSNVLEKWINVIKQSDIVFVSPCGASIGRYKDWRYLLRLLIAIKTGAHLQFHYNTIESSNNMIFDLVARYIFRHSTVRVREYRCLEYLKTKRIPSVWGPDSAFAIQSNKLYDEKISNSNVIGFVPAEFSNWHPSFVGSNIDDIVKDEILRPIVSFVQSQGFSIRIIPHFNNDSEDGFCNRIHNSFIDLGMEESKVFVDSGLQDCYGYDRSISSCRFIVGMRYHAIVLASKNAVPFLSISYEDKMNEVCRYTDMLDYSIDLKSSQLTKENMSLLLSKVDINRQLIHERLNQKAKELREVLYSDSVCELLK